MVCQLIGRLSRGGGALLRCGKGCSQSLRLTLSHLHPGRGQGERRPNVVGSGRQECIKLLDNFLRCQLAGTCRLPLLLQALPLRHVTDADNDQCLASLVEWTQACLERELTPV